MSAIDTILWNEEHDKAVKMLRNNRQHPEAFEKLLRGVQNLNAWHWHRDAEYSLLFHAVIENNHLGYNLLLTFGANPAESNNNGTNVLHLVLKRGLLDWADEAAEAVVRQCSPDKDKAAAVKEFVECPTSSGWTPMMAAAENNRTEVAQWLLKRGASANVTMPATGWTAMHAAAKKGNYDMVKLLVEAGGDPNMEARHRDFGQNLKVEDVTTDERIIRLVKEKTKT